MATPVFEVDCDSGSGGRALIIYDVFVMRHADGAYIVAHKKGPGISTGAQLC
jgi:hypothetical protein